MSAHAPRVAAGSTLGTITATQLPNTGANDTIVQIAAFVAVFMVSWYLADRIYTKSKSKV